MEIWREIVILKHKRYSNVHLPHITVYIKTVNITVITGEKLCSWQSLFFFKAYFKFMPVWFTHKKSKKINYIYCNNLGNNIDYQHLLIDLERGIISPF